MVKEDSDSSFIRTNKPSSWSEAVVGRVYRHALICLCQALAECEQILSVEQAPVLDRPLSWQHQYQPPAATPSWYLLVDYALSTSSLSLV